ncbi:serine/threonine-protein kinase [Kitasatospora terrestris]|uniref:non-specific serine/threonine protein kinase n=1 Tax=Kitasatospora terrestris TaxID=258051 RepID=A0ABP9DYZ1_9ACTN
MTAGRVVDGRYRLAEKIGHGGMGQVWAGFDERLERHVAVKLLRTDLLADPSDAAASRGEELRRRFLRECRVSAALDHPGLVTVFDAGSDGGELYLVMQRVPGLSLADLIAEDGPLPVEQAAAVAGQVCAALAAVHAVPVVHRDLKPSNVMVRDDGRVVLLDLGIATALDPDATRLTLTGSPIGSPAYMAPEQALAAGADPRSDLYALGCMLHEMLTGQAPFPAPTALGVLRRHVDDPPVPLRALRPELPAAVEVLVLDLLAKRPADRPADAQQVHARLLPLLPAPTVAPQPPHGAVPDPTRPYRYPHHPQPPSGTRPGPPRPDRRPGPGTPPPAAASVPVVMPALPDPRLAPTGPAPTPVPAPEAGPAGRAEALAEACARLSDLVAAGRHGEVLALAADLLPRAVAELGPGAPLVLTVRTIRARTLLAADRPADALAEYRALLAAHPADSPAVPGLRERAGLAQVAAGDREGGWQALLELLLDTERRLGPHHEDVRRLRRHLEQLGATRTTSGNPYTA